jgi:hypothetical protein
MELNFTKFQQGLEEMIEKNFGTHAGYQQVKSFAEGKLDKVDGRELITNARAVFSGDKRPDLLVGRALGGIQNRVETRVSDLYKAIDQKQLSLAQEVEKNQAIIDNRPSQTAQTVDQQEVVFSGRLTAEDGQKPLAGARVIMNSSKAGGAASNVIAQAVTDANGEYAIRIDKTLIRKAPQNVSISFETGKGEQFAKSRVITLSKVLGKVEVNNIQVARDKSSLVGVMVKNAEELRPQAALKMAEFKKNGAELDMFRFQMQQAAQTLKDRIGQIKGLFESAAPSK